MNNDKELEEVQDKVDLDAIKEKYKDIFTEEVIHDYLVKFFDLAEEGKAEEAVELTKKVFKGKEEACHLVKPHIQGELLRRIKLKEELNKPTIITET